MRLFAATFAVTAAMAGFAAPATACPDNDCFQKHCWSFALNDSTFLYAGCEDVESISGWAWNTLNLDKCIGVQNGHLIWENNGYFSNEATDIRIAARDFDDDQSPVIMTAKCEGPNGDADCSIDLSDQIAIGGGHISCFDEIAEIQSRSLLQRNNDKPSHAHAQVPHEEVSARGKKARKEMATRLAAQNSDDSGPPFDQYSCPDDECFWKHCGRMSVTKGENFGDSPIYFSTLCETPDDELYWNYLVLDACLANDENWLVFEKDGNFQETCRDHWVEFLPPVDEDDHDPPYVVVESDCLWVEGSIFYSVGSLSSGVWYNNGIIGCHDRTAAWMPVEPGTTSAQAWKMFQKRLASGEIDMN